MTQHTEGPWKEMRFDESQRCIIPDREDNRQPLIAIVSIGEARSDGEANARLIAAAPELLEKGNRVIAAWLNAEPGCNIAAISAELGNLREAIAKAETI